MKQNGYKKSFGLISIIMAAYNAENTIGQAITSVIQQTYTDFELIIINDCSTDRTVDVINEFIKRDTRIILINNSKNMGVSYTRKHGLDEAKGSWIAILDSDDLWLPEKLAKQVEFQKKTNADLLYTGSGFMNVDGKQINWKLNVPEVITYRQLLKQNILSNSSALVRKDLYEKYYVVGDDMHEDFAIWLQILRNGIKAYGINEPLLIYRLDDKSKSGNKLKAAMMNWSTYRYIGLNLLEAAYYEFWYAINGLCKYKHFR